MAYDKKKYSFFSSNYEQRDSKYIPKRNYTFYWQPDRYLPMREGEFVALLSMADEINKQIKKTSKIAKKERRHSDDESNRNFIQVPLPRTQKKRPNKHPAPSSDSNDSLSCDEEAVKEILVGCYKFRTLQSLCIGVLKRFNCS